MYLRAGDGPPCLQVRLPGMSDTGTTLPSVSSLLKWARGESEHERLHEQPAAVAKRPFSKLGAGDDTIPAPLTAASIQRAVEELPQGAGVALESCLTAFKVSAQNRLLVAGTSEFALRCRRLFAYACGGSGREIACHVHASSRPRAADMRACRARLVSCSPSDCRKQSLWRLHGRSRGKVLLSQQRFKRPRAATTAWR